jgi:hypothetical protein
VRGDRILNRLVIGLTSFVTLLACAGLAMLLYAAKRSGCIPPRSLTGQSPRFTAEFTGLVADCATMHLDIQR